jgi:hypothetical protein
VFDFVAAMRVQDGGSYAEKRRVRGGWGCLRAPDDAVEDLRGHESAVEEGCVGHCGRFGWFG